MRLHSVRTHDALDANKDIRDEERKKEKSGEKCIKNRKSCYYFYYINNWDPPWSCWWWSCYFYHFCTKQRNDIRNWSKQKLFTRFCTSRAYKKVIWAVRWSLLCCAGCRLPPALCTVKFYGGLWTFNLLIFVLRKT